MTVDVIESSLIYLWLWLWLWCLTPLSTIVNCDSRHLLFRSSLCVFIITILLLDIYNCTRKCFWNNRHQVRSKSKDWQAQ